MSTIISINPYTEKQVGKFETHSQNEIKEILEHSQNQFYSWRNTTYFERKNLVLNVASNLTENKVEYANKITEEIGKPISQSLAEVEKCIWLCEYYADKAENHLKNEVIKTDAFKSYTCYEPLV